MKSALITLMSVLTLSVSSPLAVAAAPELKPLWKTEGLRTPESVLVHQDGGKKLLLVSEIEGQGADVDGKGGIAKLSLEGEIIDQNWVRGLNAPKGMGVLSDKLYVADITEVVVIDIPSGKVEKRIPVEGSGFLNDVTVSEQGEVFVSDTWTHKVHRIVDGKAELWLEDIQHANGLKAIGKNLIIAAGDRLLRADAERQLTTLAIGFEDQADGVEPIAPGEYLVTCWVGLVYHVDREGKVTRLIDSREQSINTADLGYDADTGIAYIPNFFKDSVTAYQVNVVKP